MCNDITPDTVDVEIGRLNLVLREILADLGISSSTSPHSDDQILVFNRSTDGYIKFVEQNSYFTRDVHHDSILAVCHAIVAGVNLVGNVAIRIRLESQEPVFVSLRTQP